VTTWAEALRLFLRERPSAGGVDVTLVPTSVNGPCLSGLVNRTDLGLILRLPLSVPAPRSVASMKRLQARLARRRERLDPTITDQAFEQGWMAAVRQKTQQRAHV
jgi:hypothetical protein